MKKNQLGIKIKELRTKKKISQIKLSQLLGCSKIYVYRIEKGIRNPSIKKIKKISEVLECDFNYLLKN